MRESSGECAAFHERLAQPIRLAPDLLDNCLPKHRYHTLHLKVVCAAIAQHGLWVVPVIQCLQWQPVRVLEPVTVAGVDG